jgi:hypothetical protein
VHDAEATNAGSSYAGSDARLREAAAAATASSGNNSAEDGFSVPHSGTADHYHDAQAGAPHPGTVHHGAALYDALSSDEVPRLPSRCSTGNSSAVPGIVPGSSSAGVPSSCRRWMPLRKKHQ